MLTEGGPGAGGTLTRAGCRGDKHRINLFYDQKKSLYISFVWSILFGQETLVKTKMFFIQSSSITFSLQTHYWSFIGLKLCFLAVTCRPQLSHQSRRHTAGYHEDRYWFIDVPEKLWWLSESAASLVRAHRAAELCSRPCLFSSVRRSAPPEWEERCYGGALASQRFSVSRQTDERTRVTGCTKPRLWFPCWSWAGPGPSRGSLLSQNRATRRRRTSTVSR